MKNEITDAVVEAAQEMVFGDKRQYLTGDHRNMRAALSAAEAARVVGANNLKFDDDFLAEIYLMKLSPERRMEICRFHIAASPAALVPATVKA